MGITIHTDLEQGSDEWLAARCGILTASEVKLILTPTLKVADNDKTRQHVYELAAQRVTKYVEPRYISDDMIRGMTDEIEARALYERHHAPVEEVGFITSDALGFTVGYSPDGIVGDTGLIECKSRRQKYQMETITSGLIPDEYVLQLQTGLLVTGREWIDLVSYCGGMPLAVIRAYPDPAIQEAIRNAAALFEAKVAEKVEIYNEAAEKMIMTERKVEQEMFT